MAKEQNPLFDHIKNVFEHPDKYEKTTRNEKSKFFFMLQRLMSIAFPLQAQAFNHKRVSPPEVTDYWQSNMAKLYKKTPSWVYTKSKGKAAKKKIEMPSEEAIRIYLDRTKKSRRDLDAAVKFFGETALEPIRQIEKILNE